MANEYELGDLVRCSGAFTDSNGTATDPSAVLFDWRRPDNVKATYTYGTDAQLVKDSTGNYHVDLDADLVGTWYYRFYSTGTGQAADEDEFVVKTSEFD